MEYNRAQLKAINSQESRVVVVAIPGSGKTASLVGAIRQYHSEHPGDKIVAITFTRKAAAELQSKTFGLGIEASTIHSWSLKELNNLAAKHHFKVSLLQDNQIKDLLKMLSNQCNYYTLNQFMLFSYVMGNYNIDVAQSTKNKFEKVLKLYERYKRDNQLYDFMDLPLYLYDMLTLHNERIEHVDGLFVDEFQDVDDVQAKIFEMVDAKKYFYIGDPEQTIYYFRGCGPHNLTNLQGFSYYKFDTNYRSYQAIADYARTMRDGGLISDTIKLKPSGINCYRKDSPGEVYVLQDEEDTYDVVRQKTLDTRNTLVDFLLRQPFILCRSNKQVKQIEGLGYKKVSTIHQAKGLEYANVIVTDMPLKNEEEINIAYVGCTRAQNGLMIANANTLTMLMLDILMEYHDEVLGGKLF